MLNPSALSAPFLLAISGKVFDWQFQAHLRDERWEKQAWQPAAGVAASLSPVEYCLLAKEHGLHRLKCLWLLSGNK
jgi:hypothetical protein